MTNNEPRYSQSQGLILLESAIKEFGPLFTIDQIKPFAIAQNLSESNLRYLLSTLADSGWIEILKRGTYAVKSPLYSGNIPPFAIANALVQPIAISHWSALAYHGFTTQNPSMIQASTPNKVITPEMRQGNAYRPRGRATWSAFGLEFDFINVKKERFWGFQKQWVNSWTQVNITDRERSILDLITRPELFGGIRAASEIIESTLNKIDISQLVAYTLRYDVGTVIKRLGWLLERMAVSEDVLLPLHEYPVSGSIMLDPNQPRSEKYNPYWQVNENLNRS